MPFGSLQNLQFLPGIYKETSDLAAGQRWVEGNRVRFFKGQPQPIGGWQEIENENSIQGVPRGAVDWVTLDSARLISVGTNKRLYIWQGGTFYNITPIRQTGTLGADPIATVSGSAIVTITDTAHGVLEGDIVNITDVNAFNNIDLNGDYEVLTVIDANSYTVNAGTTANATGSGGGASVDFVYEVNGSSSSGAVGLGYGAGPYGGGTYGTPRAASGLVINPRTWSLANWGEDLLANPRGGSIYWHDYSGGLGNRAVLLATGSNAPTKAEFILVTAASRHVIAFGANPFGSSTQDPMHIRWATAGSFNATDDWEPLETNTSGDVTLETGYEIISALETLANQVLVWTDSAIYTMSYVGPDYIFDTALEGTSCGIRGPFARASFGAITYWMGCEEFYTYDGRVDVLPCDVKSYVFSDLNEAQRDKVFCGVNRKWNEVWWFYPSGDSEEVNRYVAYNIQDRTWDIGELERTVWLDRSETFQLPIAFDPDGVMYEQELDNVFPTGVFLESGDFQIEGGDELMFVDRAIFDFENISGNISVYFKLRKFPLSTQVTKGPYTQGPTTQKIDLRARGRSAAVRLESDAINWRLSSMRVRIKPDGIR